MRQTLLEDADELGIIADDVALHKKLKPVHEVKRSHRRRWTNLWRRKKNENIVLYLPVVNCEHKQLRVFLEEHKASEAEIEEQDDTANSSENGNKL